MKNRIKNKNKYLFIYEKISSKNQKLVVLLIGFNLNIYLCRPHLNMIKKVVLLWCKQNQLVIGTPKVRKMSYIFRLKYEKIKETFEANPNRDFNITELKEITSISSNTISKYIELLLKNNLIEEVSFACSSRYRYPRSKYIFSGCKNAIEVGGIY